MMKKLSGKVAIVTGAAGAGIGQGISRVLAGEGANVVVSDAHPKRPFSVADDIKKLYGVEALGVQCDVRDKEQVGGMMKQALDKFGRIDILVNNAGIAAFKSVIDMSDEDWDLVINVNLKGTFFCCRAALPVMIKQRSGRVINLSSITAWAGPEAASEGTAYAAAKAGITAFTRVLACEVGEHNITVNAIAPAAIWNEYIGSRPGAAEYWDGLKQSTAVKRLGVPEDIANVVLFLASDEASFITGEAICVSGGRFMHA